MPDDIWAIVKKYHQLVVNSLLQTFQKFQDFSGFKINFEKMQAIHLDQDDAIDKRIELNYPIRFVQQVKIYWAFVSHVTQKD